MHALLYHKKIIIRFAHSIAGPQDKLFDMTPQALREPFRRIDLALLMLIAQDRNDIICIAHAQMRLFYSTHAKCRLDLQSSLRTKSLNLMEFGSSCMTLTALQFILPLATTLRSVENNKVFDCSLIFWGTIALRYPAAIISQAILAWTYGS